MVQPMQGKLYSLQEYTIETLPPMLLHPTEALVESLEDDLTSRIPVVMRQCTYEKEWSVNRTYPSHQILDKPLKYRDHNHTHLS